MDRHLRNQAALDIPGEIGITGGVIRIGGEHGAGALIRQCDGQRLRMEVQAIGLVFRRRPHIRQHGRLAFVREAGGVFRAGNRLQRRLHVGRGARGSLISRRTAKQHGRRQQSAYPACSLHMVSPFESKQYLPAMSAEKAPYRRQDTSEIIRPIRLTKINSKNRINAMPRTVSIDTSTFFPSV